MTASDRKRQRKHRPARSTRLLLEKLEERLALTVQPLTLADPSVWGLSGLEASTAPSISADGQLIAFQSDADDLVPNDTNGVADVFVFHRTTGSVTLVSVGTNGQAGGGTGPAISPDGRYVAFESNTRKILPSFTNDNQLQLYLRDLQSNSTSLVTLAANGTDGGNRGSGDSTNPGTSLVAFSADSKHVGFLSRSGNLVDNVTFASSWANVFTRDLVVGTTTLVSASLNGDSDGNAQSNSFSLSADARFVAFQSSASNLTSQDNFSIEQVFLRDTLFGTTKLVSADTSGGLGGNGHNLLTTRAQTISADGRFVVFRTNADNVVSNSVNGTNSYIRDTVFDQTQLVSASSTTGTGVGGSNGSEIISPEGRWSAFATSASGLTTLPTNGRTNVYLRNNLTGAVSLVTVNQAGTAGGNGNSGVGTFFDFPGGLSFSANGRYLTFRSLATDLVPGVTTAARNLYARDLLDNTTILLTPNAAGSDGGDGDTDPGVLSADGRVVAFPSKATNLLAGDANGFTDIFVREITAAHPVIASRRSELFGPERLALLGGTLGDVSADGRYVVFMSRTNAGGQSDLTPGLPGTGDNVGVYVRDRQTGGIQAVDLLPNGQRGGAVTPTLPDQGPVITPDGRYVVFLSRSKELVAGGGITYTPNSHNLFIRDLQTQTTRLVSATPDGSHDVPVPQNTLFAISDDGRYVAFSTNINNPFTGVTNDGNGRHYLLMRDLGDGVSPPTTVLVSRTTPDESGVRHITGDTSSLSLSNDGRYVAFTSNDSNLAANDTNGVFGHDVFRWDRTTGNVTLVSKNSAGSGAGNERSEARRNGMSPDGRYIVFQSSASDLIAGDTNGRQDVFLRDMQTDTLTLVSVNTGGVVGGNNQSFDASISADGQHVAFVSNATNLTTHSIAASANVFVRHLGASPSTALVSVNAAGTASGNGTSNGLGAANFPLLSADGRYVIFNSHASNLVAGYVDGNAQGFQQQDLFLRDLQLGLTKALNVNQSGTATGNASQFSGIVRLTDDGRTVAFTTGAGDLVIGDRNGVNDVVATPTAGFGTISGRVFHDENANGTKDGGEVGLPYWTVFLDADGNGRRDLGETRVFTDAGGNYAFTGLLSGTYTIAVVPQLGYQQTLPIAPATYTVSVALDGDSVTGREFGEFLPRPDLQTSHVSVTPGNVVASEAVTVRWTVTNVGNAVAAGNWQDAVYLSPTRSLGANAQLLGIVPHEGGLSRDDAYDGSVTVALPPTPGTWFLIVQADRRQQVSEDATRANNVDATTGTLGLSIPLLTLGVPVNGQLSPVAPDRYFRLDVPAGSSATLTLDSAATSGQVDVYVKRGALPTRYDYDVASGPADTPDRKLTIPLVEFGDIYVLVHGSTGPAIDSPFTLTVAQPGPEISHLEITAGGNGGRVTIPIHGADLPRDGVVSLVSGAATIDAVTLHYTDASLLYATFDLFEKPQGIYDVRISKGLQSTTLDDGFTVEPARPSEPIFDLATPSGVRVNRPFGRVIWTYSNPGNVDIVAPLVTLAATNALLRLPGQSAYENDVQFLCISSTGPAGVLRPGQSAELTVEFQFTGGLGDDIELSSVIADDAQAMDWAAHKDALRPVHIPADAWGAIYGNFTAAVGNTVGSYHQVLAEDASYLGELGEYTADVSRLAGFELNKAGNLFTGRALASVVDASIPAPGLSLSFARQFLQSLAGRYTLGPLGRGWTHNWEINATTEGNGDVAIVQGGVRRFFAKQADGTYQGTAGEFATLALVDGAYRLRETDGTQIAFRVDGTLNTVQDANGNRITAGYTSGRLTTLTHSSGAALVLTYNAEGRIIQVADPANRTTTFAYDTAGEHLLGYTDKYGSHSYHYLTGQTNPALDHALTEIAFSDDTHIYFGYDTRGRLISHRRDNDQEQLTYAYGVVGGHSVTTTAGETTTYRIDDAGQVVESINPLGHVVRYDYDAARNRTQIRSPLGVTYVYAFDARGNLTGVTDPLDRDVSFTYDAANHLTGFRDAKGNTTVYRPNAAGDLLSITYAKGTFQQFEYDPLGNLTEAINARGQALQYVYYPNGLLQRKTYADATVVQYEYDARGNLTKVTDRAGQDTVMEYDAADNLHKITYPGGRFLEFEYNTVGQRTQSVDQTGFTVNYVYDALGRLWKLLDGDSGLVVQYTYDATGRLIRKDLGNGTYTTYEYDAAGQLLHLVNHAPQPTPEQSGPVNSRFDYTYDALGRVTRVDDSNGRWDYTFDALGQLTRGVFTSNDMAVLPDQDLQYFYDAAGNRTHTIINGVTTTYTVNNTNEYTQVGGTTYTYDLDGNRVTATTDATMTTYAFDQESRLTGITSPTDVWGFEYDALGNRVARNLNGQIERYQVDPVFLGTRVAAFNGSGELLRHFTHGLGLVSQVSATGEAAYYDFDWTGSSVGITGQAGAYSNRYAYLPWGQFMANSGSVASPFSFLGQHGVVDDGANLFHMHGRNYDPGIGRFISNDPLGLAGGDTNVRHFVATRPSNAIDPSGFDDIVNKSFQPRLGDPPNSNAPPPGGDGGSGGGRPSVPPTGGAGGPGGRIPPLGAFDPNELVGPAGVGVDNWIAANRQWLPYTIGFENDPVLASVAAQDVVVTQQLDADLDWTTFQFGEIRFGATIVSVPAGLQAFATSVATTNIDGTPLRVDITARFSADDGVATWKFLSLDPATGQWPENPVAGFLPVNDATNRGQGYLEYSVRAQSGLSTGTEIRGVANIVFDTNAPIATNQAHPHDPSQGTDPNKEALTTIDAGAPTSQVTGLPPISDVKRFFVAWDGADDLHGSGVSAFDVYVSDDGGPFVPWLTSTSATTAEFAGQAGHSYRFYTRARDAVGNVEAAPGTPDATTVIELQAHTPSLTSSATDEDTPTTTGLVVSRNPVDGEEVTHVLVTDIVGGTLFLHDGATRIVEGSFVPFLEAAAGLVFLPARNAVAPGSFSVQASLGADHSGLGGDPVTATIAITPVNDPPSDISLAGNSVTENDAGAIAGDVTVTDPDAGDSHTFTVSDNRFDVSAGQLRLKPGISLDYESDPSVRVDVTARDADGLSLTKSFTVIVNDVSEGVVDIDADGIPSSIEEAAPNNGDGNRDGLPDAQQPNVASLRNAAGQYVTLATPASLLRNVVVVPHPSPATTPAFVDLPLGFFGFEVPVPNAGDSTTVTLFLHDGQRFNTYYRFGPTPGDSRPHWYRFVFDGTTGAEIFADRIVLHLRDGARGDDDTQENRLIVDPGAPAIDQRPTPYQNPVFSLDVNDDNLVSPLDALVIIRDLNQHGSRDLPTPVPLPIASFPFLDVTGDGRATPLDALVVIGDLNARGSHSLASAGAEPPTSRAEAEPTVTYFANVEPVRIEPRISDTSAGFFANVAQPDEHSLIPGANHLIRRAVASSLSLTPLETAWLRAARERSVVGDARDEHVLDAIADDVSQALFAWLRPSEVGALGNEPNARLGRNHPQR